MLPNTNSEKFHLGRLMPFTRADLSGEFLSAEWERLFEGCGPVVAIVLSWKMDQQSHQS